MGKKINVYFNICVLPHKKQFGRVPCSFGGFPYLNSFHTSALGVPWGLRSEGADSPFRAKPVVRQPAGTAAGDNADVLASLCGRFPGSRLCRLRQAPSSDFSVLQMNSSGIEASAESASAEQKSLLFRCGFVSVGGRRALTCSPPASQPSAGPFPRQQRLVPAPVSGGFSVGSLLPDTWLEALPRHQRRHWQVSF